MRVEPYGPGQAGGPGGRARPRRIRDGAEELIPVAGSNAGAAPAGDFDVRLSAGRAGRWSSCTEDSSAG